VREDIYSGAGSGTGNVFCDAVVHFRLSDDGPLKDVKRRLLGQLCRAAVEALLKYFQAATGAELRPGVVASIQTFGQKINLHPLCGVLHNG